MARLRKRRIIWQEPKPAICRAGGVRLESLGRITLLREVRQAVCLADLEGQALQTEVGTSVRVSWRPRGSRCDIRP